MYIHKIVRKFQFRIAYGILPTKCWYAYVCTISSLQNLWHLFLGVRTKFNGQSINNLIEAFMQHTCPTITTLPIFFSYFWHPQILFWYFPTQKMFISLENEFSTYPKRIYWKLFYRSWFLDMTWTVLSEKRSRNVFFFISLHSMEESNNVDFVLYGSNGRLIEFNLNRFVCVVHLNTLLQTIK